MSNFHKLWLQDSINRAALARARAQIAKRGLALPCRVTKVDGAIVTVSFEIDPTVQLPEIAMPKAESPWVRMPTQVGDYGYTVPADAVLVGIDGLGSGVASLTQPFNMEALVFVPVSNANSPPTDQNAAQVQGPNGAIIQTTTGTTSRVVTNQNGTTVTYGSNTISINDSTITLTAGGKTLTIGSAGITLDGILWETHAHSGVTTGSGTSGPPV